MTKNQRRLVRRQRVQPGILLPRDGFYFSALLLPQLLPERFLGIDELGVDDDTPVTPTSEETVVLPIIIAEVADGLSGRHVADIMIAAETHEADRRIHSTKRGLQRPRLAGLPRVVALLSDIFGKFVDQIASDDRELRLEAVDVVDGL